MINLKTMDFKVDLKYSHFVRITKYFKAVNLLIAFKLSAKFVAAIAIIIDSRFNSAEMIIIVTINLHSITAFIEDY